MNFEGSCNVRMELGLVALSKQRTDFLLWGMVRRESLQWRLWLGDFYSLSHLLGRWGNWSLVRNVLWGCQRILALAGRLVNLVVISVGELDEHLSLLEYDVGWNVPGVVVVL